MPRPLTLVAIAVAVAATGADASRATRRTPVVAAVEQVAPAVANISTEEVVLQRYRDPFWGGRDQFFNDMFDEFFGRYHYRKAKVAKPLGSGVLIDQDGYIVTNEHVVSRASTIKVHLKGRDTVYNATLISSDPKQDLAVIKIEDTTPLPYIRMGTSSDLMSGETVIAIGNPFGYESSVTTGVLSATGREVSVPTSKGRLVYHDLIQTTALINQGNSGGPLINIDGELIGINTAIRADAQGIGFAIAVDRVRDVLAMLFSFQNKKKLWLGATVEATPEAKPGVVVTKLHDDGPARKAGLRVGDVIVRAGDLPIQDLLGFAKYMFKREPGDRVSLVVAAQGGRRTVDVALLPVPKPSGQGLAKSRLGLTVQTLTPRLARRLGLRLGEGVLVVEVARQGPGAEALLQAGDIIVRMGGYLVRNVDDLSVLLDAQPSGAVLPMLFVRRGHVVWRTEIEAR